MAKLIKNKNVFNKPVGGFGNIVIRISCRNEEL